MLDAIAGGVEIGAIMLAAAVLIGFVLVRPSRQPQPRCYFDGMTAIYGKVEVGGDECSGPPEYRWTYVINNRDSMQIQDILVCAHHIAAAEQRVELARELLELDREAS